MTTDKELKYSTKKRLSDYDVINHSTIGVIFLLSDSSRFVDYSEQIYSRTCERKRRRLAAEEGGDQTKENRPELSSLQGSIAIANIFPDFMDFELRPDLYRAIMPCMHIMGKAETTRIITLMTTTKKMMMALIYSQYVVTIAVSKLVFLSSNILVN